MKVDDCEMTCAICDAPLPCGVRTAGSRLPVCWVCRDLIRLPAMPRQTAERPEGPVAVGA